MRARLLKNVSYAFVYFLIGRVVSSRRDVRLG
jgi:hypothetical protein